MGAGFEVSVDFVAPAGPAGDAFAGEELEAGAGAALLDDAVDLGRLAGMFLLAGLEEIYLTAAGRERAQAAFDAEEQQLGDVAEIEADAAAVGGRRPCGPCTRRCSSCR